MSKISTVLLVVVALVIGGVAGFLVERSRATATLEAYKLTAQKQLDDAKMMAAKQATPTAAMMPDIIGMTKGTGIITDGKGMTLYTFAKDTKNVSNCSGQCLVNWPAFLVVGQVPSSLPANLATFKRTDGSMQYSWKGMPLYYYIGDKKPGDMSGDGVGGVWHVAK